MPLGNAGIRANRPAHKISTRIANSSKPTFAVAEPVFYRCPRCARLFVQTRAGDGAALLRCCGETLYPLTPRDAADQEAARHLPVMVVSGGFESNALAVSVGEPPHPMTPEHHLEWIYLYTFQGGQLKFLAPGEPAAATFALAEKDAYVYCDRPVCKGSRCKFNCKRGFTAYAYCNRHGLWSARF